MKEVVINQVIPDGYKKCEIGVIPEDWEAINFGDLFEPSIIRKRLKPKDQVTFIGMQDVSESAQLIFPSKKAYENIKAGLTYFERNDVLLAKITPCFENGKGCHTYNLDTRVGFGSTEFHVLRAKKESDSKFIYFWTTKNSFRQDLEGEMVGSAGHRRVPLTAIQNYKIPCPVKGEEQTAIANALSDVDTFLSELEKLIAKKQAIKTATMQQLLTGKTRLPQFSTYAEDAPEENIKGQLKGKKTSELGEIPEDWEIAKLSQLTTMMTNGFVGTAKSHYTDNSDGVLYIQGYNVIENSFNFRGIKRVTEEFHKRQSKSNLREGDVLMVQTGDVGLTTIVPEKLAGSNCHALIISRFKTKEFDPGFYSYYLNSKLGRLRLKELEVGTTMKHINVGDLLHFSVPLPSSKEEQTAIATIFSDMDKEMQALDKRLSKTRQIKQGMMQELLTGKTRLPFDKN